MTDANASSTGTEDLLECPVCLEEYSLAISSRAPLTLPCLHSLCLDCLNRLRSHYRSHCPLVCPLCRQTATEAFENYFIINILKQKQKKEDASIALLLQKCYDGFGGAISKKQKLEKEPSADFVAEAKAVSLPDQEPNGVPGHKLKYDDKSANKFKMQIKRNTLIIIASNSESECNEQD